MAALEYTKEGKIAYITINRPEALNALSNEVMHGLRNAMNDFRDDDNLWVAIVSGAGDKAFSAGADIKEFKPDREEVPMRADKIWKPFIAAIQGYCLGGGCELAMSCDIRIAAENAQFGQPEINIGYMAGGGGTIRLPRFVPRAVASEMLLTGNRISAQDALRCGLISRVVPREKLMDTAKEIANTIISRGPLGVRATKEAIIRGYEMDLEEGLALEQELAARIRDSEDFMEGARAFAEKRSPQYKAR
ncbi:MAG: enoyl-CoA hydratase/isomerase family protein [Dehalococcoidales bacterium]|nr:enoyl-CoA hydratase/isomerase family protein [Dehalococcoidales bacterium]